MKSGGQSLDEITKFCKEISKKGLESEDKFTRRAALVDKLERTWWKHAMPNLKVGDIVLFGSEKKGRDCRVQASRRSERVALYLCEAGGKETSSAKACSHTAMEWEASDL